ncbi:MAG TPA: endonuclease/exonuclease/phosphatase family protein [Verrucomicrobiae bacterium]|nr:endonuclease/exonuclease/phosphatase family protein [Verrucomicrobiae bacterium]
MSNSRKEPRSRIRIASYNLWWHKAYHEVAEIVDGQQLDIICLQECYPSDLKKSVQGLRLAGSHAYVHRLPLIHRQSKKTATTSAWKNAGMAIYYNPRQLELISLERFALPLPWQERNGGRIFQVAHFKVLATGKLIVVANIHLSALLAPSRARRKQLQEILQGVTAQGDTLPVILAGDFNYPLVARSLHTLMEAEGFTECGAHVSMPTHMSRVIKGKFDRIFISEDVEEQGYAILPFGLSDHAPITATLGFA